MIDSEIEQKIDDAVRMMSPAERRDIAIEIYESEWIPRDETRSLLGIDEQAFSERCREYWMESLESGFEDLPESLLAERIDMMRKGHGEY